MQQALSFFVFVVTLQFQSVFLKYYDHFVFMCVYKVQYTIFLLI